jgi:glycine/D-amino acid oxidase-like deaminating enzyme
VALGADSRVVDAAEMRRLAPALAIDDDEVAAWEPGSGYADPSMTASSLVRSAVARGARLVQGAEVTAVRTSGGRVAGVDTTKGAIDAPVVVDAAGGWASRVAALVGLDIPLTVWRHDTGYLGVPASVARPIPVVIDIANAMYFRPEGTELVLIGLEPLRTLDPAMRDLQRPIRVGIPRQT